MVDSRPEITTSPEDHDHDKVVLRGIHRSLQESKRILRCKRLPGAVEIVNRLHHAVLFPFVRRNMAGEMILKYRTQDVMILGAVARPSRHGEIPGLMEEYGKNVDGMIKDLLQEKRSQKNIVHGFLDLLAYSHYTLYNIHPWYDGHKRTAFQFTQLLCKMFGFRQILIGPAQKEAYFDSMERVTQTGDIRYFTVFLADRLASQYNTGSRDDLYTKKQIDLYKGSLLGGIGNEARKPAVHVVAEARSLQGL